MHDLENVLRWVWEDRKWLFSGIGVATISVLIWFIGWMRLRREGGTKLQEKSEDRSIKVGRDISNSNVSTGDNDIINMND